MDAAKASLPRHSGDGKKHSSALPYAEVPALMETLARREGIAAPALRFTILTAARSGEVRGMRWNEVDLENAAWTVPGSRMKAKKDHRVPLIIDALAVLGAVQGLDRDLAFPAERRGRPLSDMTLIEVLKRMGRGDLTVHCFRSAFRDWAAERTSFPREIAEPCLAHEVDNVVERAYRRSDMFEKRRQFIEAWARFCCPVRADATESEWCA